MLKRIFSLTMIALLALVSEARDFVGDLDEYPFIIVTKDTVQNLPPMSDEDFYSSSVGVIFQVNRTEIRRDDPFFKLYHNVIVPVINSSNLQLRKVFIRGAASPEGPYANNHRLGRGRSQALLAELQGELNHQYVSPEIDINSVTEDYGYLCLLMREANDPDYAVVQQIYDECEGNELACKFMLRLVQDGKLWNRLLKEYFPRLRSARVVLWFTEPYVEAPLATFQPIVTEPSQLNPVFPGQAYVPVFDAPVPSVRRHLLAVRTNLLHDAFYMPQFGWAPSPNVQLEYYPRDGHLTYNVGMTWGTHRHWDTQEFFQARDFQAEIRSYFRGGGDFTGAYAGLYAQGNVYGIGLSRSKGWEGEGGGAGLSLGYVVPINRKGSLRLEFMAAAGFYLSLFDPYVYGNPITGTIDGDYYYNYLGSGADFKKRNHRFTWLGPTNLGIQLTYDIIYRRRHVAQKGGTL